VFVKTHGNKIQFNGVDGSRTYIDFTDVDKRIRRNKMYDREKRTSPVILPIVTLIVAVVGTAGILLNDFDPGNASQGTSNPEMITAAAVSRVGAIEIPSVPPAGQR
jgi:hypothetical protein